MNLRTWLQRLLGIEGNTGRGFLHTFFRRSPRILASLSNKQKEVFEQISFRDGYRIRLGATRELVTGVAFRESSAPPLQLATNTTVEEVKSLMERLSQTEAGGLGQFPLDIYWSAISPALLQADEWLHYGNGSRQLSFNFFLAGVEAGPENSPDEFNFSLHCTSEAVLVKRH